MPQQSARQYHVVNMQRETCPLCNAFNNAYHCCDFENEIHLPSEMGEGYCRRTLLSSALDMTVTDMTLLETQELKGELEHHSLSFCLGSPFHWRVEGIKGEQELFNGECYLFQEMEGCGICRYEQGQRFWGVNLQLDQAVMKSFFQCMGKERVYDRITSGSSRFYKMKYSSAVRLILSEMIQCDYQDNIKKLYLEGKAMELAAVFLNELTLQKKDALVSRLSATDRAALQQAKEILDRRIMTPPTIRQLARLVCLNEYKLKTGFKEVFNMPVHAYIIDKRMELARLLLEREKLSVTETVQRVGYSDASHFAEKFRRKYGVNPSEMNK